MEASFFFPWSQSFQTPCRFEVRADVDAKKRAEQAKLNENWKKDYEAKVRKELKPLIKKEIMSKVHLDND